MLKRKKQKIWRNESGTDRKCQDGKNGGQYREIRPEFCTKNAEWKAQKCALRDTQEVRNGERKGFIFKEWYLCFKTFKEHAAK